jgi:formylglycine-generating enzyme required for sulfatase activity
MATAPAVGAPTSVDGVRPEARGGGWSDRPKRASAEFRLLYKPYLGVYNVGFRVITESVSEPKVAVVSPDARP